MVGERQREIDGGREIEGERQRERWGRHRTTETVDKGVTAME